MKLTNSELSHLSEIRSFLSAILLLVDELFELRNTKSTLEVQASIVDISKNAIPNIQQKIEEKESAIKELKEKVMLISPFFFKKVDRISRWITVWDLSIPGTITPSQNNCQQKASMGAWYSTFFDRNLL